MSEKLRDGLALFLLAFLIYNINFRSIVTGDSVPAALMPIVILTKGSMVMDEYNQYYLDYYKEKFHGQESIPAPYFFTPTKFGYLSSYPVATGLLLTPFYAVPVYLYNLAHPTTAQWVFFAVVAEKISASAITAVAVVLFYLLSLRLGAGRIAALTLSFAYAFGSEAWSTSSQALWQHGPGILFLLAACLVAFSSEDGSTVRKTLLFGLLCGIAVAVRPTNLLFCLPLLVWFGMRHPEDIGWCVAFFVAVLFAVGTYNSAVFGNVRGGYAQPLDGVFWEGFTGILFSPGRGLLPYFPFAMFGFLGYFRSLRGGGEFVGFYSVLFVFVVLQVIVVSKWPSWWGGYSFGPRLLAETQPALLLMAVPLFSSAGLARLKWGVFCILLSWALCIQLVGAFIYPLGQWNGLPEDVNKAKVRLWDWRDNPVRRDLAAFIDSHRQK